MVLPTFSTALGDWFWFWARGSGHLARGHVLGRCRCLKPCYHPFPAEIIDHFHSLQLSFIMGILRHHLEAFILLLGISSFTSARTLGPRVSPSATTLQKTPLYPHQAYPGFQCIYPSGWTSCNGADSRDCWVKSPYGTQYDINTDCV